MLELDKEFKIINGNSLDVLDTIEPNSIGSIVCDPPYELGFMGKGWDKTGIAYNVELWKKAYRVLKPGAYLLAFGGSRTFHRIACAIEDAGFEIRDTIIWMYGCLSEDTEVLTKNGFKRFRKITEDDMIRVYDIKNKIYKWEKPEKWNVYKVDKDTCFRIKSNSTDQLVSKNHRCLVERKGKLVFEYAEKLSKMERVPVLSYDIPFLQKGESDILFSNLLWQDENLASKIFEQWKREKESKKSYVWTEKSSMERWSNLSQKERELCEPKYKICKVPKRVYNNGEKRWLCNGASFESSDDNKTTIIKNGSCASYQSQCRRQQNREFDVIFNKQRSQTIRTWCGYKTTLATIEKVVYSGFIFCPTVSTGCFVARRKGKVFITGNSGFPKSMNISKGIEAREQYGNAGTRAKRQIEQNCDGEEYKIKAPNNGVFGEIKEWTRKEYEPKSELAKKWKGYGTCLKPAYEPIIVARKPCEGSCIDNVIKYGVGGINIDECRVEYGKETDNRIGTDAVNTSHCGFWSKDAGNGKIQMYKDNGRFPANIIHDGSEEVVKDMPNSGSGNGGEPYNYSGKEYNNKQTSMFNGDKPQSNSNYNDNGSASRYFYCAKASSKDRDEGLELGFEKRIKVFNGQSNQSSSEMKDIEKRFTTECRNTHVTVKPTSLMQYLVRLVTPKGETVLDIFNGSGSTGKAVAFENRERNANYKYIGIELSQEYCAISEARIIYALHQYEYERKLEAKKSKEEQLDLFEIMGE